MTNKTNNNAFTMIRTLRGKNLVVVRGFTMIEMLIVISIIGVLATLLLASFVGIQKQARDTQRKSDLKQFQNALESYANKYNGLYPVEAGVSTGADLCSDLTMTNCPADPKDGTAPYGYHYQTDADGTLYTLWAHIEGQTDTIWEICSTGKLGPTSATPSLGNCSL